MNKIILTLWIFFLVSCVARDNSIINKHQGEVLPSFNFISPNAKEILNTKTISSNKPLVFFLFQPDCPNCQAETKAILSKAEILKNIDIYFLSFYSIDDVKNFSEKYGLTKYPNIKVVVDSKFEFVNYFQPGSVPYIAIYGTNKRLKKVFKGQIKPELIKEVALY